MKVIKIVTKLVKYKEDKPCCSDMNTLLGRSDIYFLDDGKAVLSSAGMDLCIIKFCPFCGEAIQVENRT